MIIKRDIENLLKDLESYYNSNTIPRSTHYSKLAVIELCGWLEESFDKIAKRCVKGKIQSVIFTDVFNNGIVELNFGFKYNMNFRKMMLSTIGVIHTEKLESELIFRGEKVILVSILDNLTKERNRAAHNTDAGATPTYQAPSITLIQLSYLYPIIRNMYSFAVNYNSTI